ncbi:hypothetical protein [Flavobacterium sp.]
MKKVVMLVAILFGTSVMVNASTPKKQEVKQETKKEMKKEVKKEVVKQEPKQEVTHAKKAVEAKKVVVKTETKTMTQKPALEAKVKK